MSWAEFQIRSFAYNRIQEREDLRAREIAWSSLIGPHYDPKKLPKSKNEFWSIGKKVPVINDRIRKAIEGARNKYLKSIKTQENGD